MATLIFGVAGAAVGSLFGNPALGWSIGTAIGAQFDRETPPAKEGDKLSDLRITGSGYGIAIPQVFGQARLGGNIIWVKDNQIDETRVEERSGGNFWSEGQLVVSYTYAASFAVAVCRGPIQEITRILADGDTSGPICIYDQSNPTGSQYTDYLTIYLGGEAQTPDSVMVADLGSGNVPAYRGIAYIVFDALPLKEFGNRIPNLSFEVKSGVSVTVAGVLNDIAGQAGIGSGDRDFSAATATVVGYVVAGRQEARQTISTLLQVYAIDLAEVDYQVKAVARGGSIDLTVDDDDFGARVWDGGGDPPSRLETRRISQLELPVRLDFSYLSADRFYDRGTQGAIRYAKPDVQNSLSIDAPVVLDDNTARRVAERSLYTAWIERDHYTFALPPKYLRICPGSPVNLTVNGETVRARVNRVDMGLFGEIRCQAVREDTDILTQSVAGGSSPVTPPALYTVVPTSFAVWSTPTYLEGDLVWAGYYVAATGATGWLGCVVYQSLDAGVTWLRVGEITDRASLGTANTVLSGYTNFAYQDEINTVDVTLSSTGTLESTYLQAVTLFGANKLLIGPEIIGFVTATPLGGLQYRLSNLKRGQHNTQHQAGSHAIGDLVVLLRTGILRVNASGLLGYTVHIKCVSDGQTLADVTAKSVVVGGGSNPYTGGGSGEIDAGGDIMTASYLLEQDSNGDWMPVEGSATDPVWELDASDNIMPRA